MTVAGDGAAHLEEQHRTMEAWASYLHVPRPGKVEPIYAKEIG